MRILNGLALGCICTLLFVETSLANVPLLKDTEADGMIAKSKLTLEERQYVLTQCEGFSKEDGISDEHLSAYLKTCFDELSAAVLIAIDELNTKSESMAANSNP